MSGIREVIEKIVKDTVVMALQSATVTAVDGETCTVQSDHDERDYFQVSFNALGANKADKLLLVPKAGSKVIIGVFPNGTDAVLVSFSEVEKLEYTVGTTLFEIDGQGYRLERNAEDLRTVLADFMDEVMKIVVIQGQSINVPVVTQIKARLNTILK